MIALSFAVDSTNLSEENQTALPLFTKSRNGSNYLFDRDKLTSKIPEGNISCPLVVDTEYLALPVHHTKGSNPGRKGITTQIKGIAVEKGIIMAHPGVAHLLPRFPVTSFGFHPVDYLNLSGFEASIVHAKDTPIDLRDLPTCEFVLYSHFSLAEAAMIVSGDYRDDVVELMRAKKGNRLTMLRRLRAVSMGEYEQDSVVMPWVLTLNGIQYAIKMSYIDSCGLHGNASYKDLAKATGIKLEHKDNFTPQEKGNMLEMAVTRPEDFDNYALGDLEVYEILEANANNFKTIYTDLLLESFYKPPRLTMGSTVNDLFEAALKNRLGIDKEEWDWTVEHLIEPTSAKYLKENVQSTSALLSKVTGGRCRNNIPTITKVYEIICDLDIAGCYGEGQRNQLYPIGKPEIIKFDTNSTCNEYPSLRQVLKEYGFVNPRNPGELVPGLFKFIASTHSRLKIPQDFFPSLTVGSKTDLLSLAKYAKAAKSDTERVSVEYDRDEGQQKIFNYEIHNTEITWDSLDWLWYVASPQQRKELLDELHVTAGLVYPRSYRVDSFLELKTAHQNHKDKNKNRRKGQGKKARRVYEDGECHAWYAVNLGELLIDDLLANRKLYPKKTPLNELFKLCINNLYGDMTSHYFSCSNAVVGANITARARALAYYMEKGLNAFQTITDGGAFQLNKVAVPKSGRKLTAAEGVNFYRKHKNTNISTAPLGSHRDYPDIGKIERIDLNWYETEEEVNNDGVIEIKIIYQPLLTLRGTKGIKSLKANDALAWINQTAMEHLQNLFPSVSVLHADSTSLKPTKDTNGKALKNYIPRKGQFEFESKALYDTGIFHGTANYCLKNPNGDNLKYRSYETKKRHESVDHNLQVTDRYGDTNNPAKDFINAIYQDPTAIPRQPPFTKEGIIKVSDYKNRIKTWESLGLVPGDSYYKPGHLKEFSLSQFTFNTLEQLISWEKAITLHKKRYGQSLEMFFLNEDDTLNYQDLITTVDKLIAEDCMNPFQEFNKSRNYCQTIPHPHFHTLTRLRESLRTPADHICEEGDEFQEAQAA